jgi:hypothetical protein
LNSPLDPKQFRIIIANDDDSITFPETQTKKPKTYPRDMLEDFPPSALLPDSETLLSHGDAASKNKAVMPQDLGYRIQQSIHTSIFMTLHAIFL